MHGRPWNRVPFRRRSTRTVQKPLKYKVYCSKTMISGIKGAKVSDNIESVRFLLKAFGSRKELIISEDYEELAWRFNKRAALIYLAFVSCLNSKIGINHQN